MDDIREALGYKNNKAVRAVIRRVLGTARASDHPKPPRPHRRRSNPDGQEGLPVSILTSRDRTIRRLIARRAQERHGRLEALLRASGLHVSQMTPQQLGNRVRSDA